MITFTEKEFFALVDSCFTLLIVLIIGILLTIIITVSIKEHGKTKRAKFLADESSPKKKQKSAEKQLEKDLFNENDIASKIIGIADKLHNTRE